MCLFIDRKYHVTNIPSIAKKDIVVYKVINMTNCSFHRDYYYHAYLLEDHVDIFLSEGSNSTSSVEEGYHAFQWWLTAYLLYREFNNVKIVKMIIPKGSYYFMGTAGEIVSSQILSGNLEHMTFWKWLASKLKFW